MKIAYVTLHLEKRYIFGGVGRKIREHVRIWNEMGHPTRQFLLTPDEIDIPEITTFLFAGQGKPKMLRFIRREISRSRQLGRLIDAVSEYRPDLIYLRFGMFTLPLPRLFRIAPVIMEVNSDDSTEYRQKGLFFYLLNLLTRGQMFNRAGGLVLISRELSERAAFSRFGKPMLVLPNGINLQTAEELPAPGNSVPRLAFVGVPGFLWNGEDKLIQFARMYPDIQLDLIGYTRRDVEAAEVPDNVVFHGMVAVQKVRELLANADATAGTLALHRKQLQENSALKVREALAYGIPTILGYHDTDVSGRGLEGILELPNTEDNVQANAEKIRAWVYSMVGKRVNRQAVAPLIDQKLKEEKRLAFFRQILDQRRQPSAKDH